MPAEVQPDEAQVYMVHVQMHLLRQMVMGTAIAWQAARVVNASLDAQAKLRDVSAEQKTWRVKLIKPRKGRDNGEWVLRIYGPGISRYGKREKTGIPYSSATEKQAERIREAKEKHLNAVGGEDPLTVLQVYRRWLDARVAEGTLAEESVKAYRKPLFWLEQNGWGGMQDGELTSARLLKVQDKMLSGAQLKVKSCNWIFDRVVEAWVWAKARALVGQDWPSMPRKKVPSVQKTKKRAYTSAELAEVLEWLRVYLGGHYLAAGWLIAETGVRISEAMKLRGKDISRSGDGYGIAAFQAKGGKLRVGCFSPQLAELIGEVEDDAWVFTSRRSSGRPMDGKALRRAVKKKVKAMGLEGLRDVHSLRRSAVAELHANNFGLGPAMQFFGHESSAAHMVYATKASYDILPMARTLWLNPLAHRRTNGLPCEAEQGPTVMDLRPRPRTGSSRPRGERALDRALAELLGSGPAGPALRGFLAQLPDGSNLASSALRSSLNLGGDVSP